MRRASSSLIVPAFSCLAIFLAVLRDSARPILSTSMRSQPTGADFAGLVMMYDRSASVSTL